MPNPKKKKKQIHRGGRRPKLKDGPSTSTVLDDAPRKKKKKRGDTLGKPRKVGLSAVDHPKRVLESIATFIDRLCDERGIADYTKLSKEMRIRIADEAKQLHDLHNEFKADPPLKKEFDKLGGVFLAPDRRNVMLAAEIAAMRRTPFAAAVRDVLGGAAPVHRAKRVKALAMYEQMIYGHEAPEQQKIAEQLFTPNPTVDYIYDGVQSADCGQDIETLRKVFSRMLKRHADSDVLIEQNLAMIREFAASKPQIGRHCAIDGTIVPGAFDQAAASSGTEREKVLLRGKSAGPITHGHGFARGWYTVVIVDIATGLPLIWRNFKGAELRTVHVLELVKELQERWPECPIETLVGDSEFSKSPKLSLELVLGHGIQPIFPLRKNSPKPSPHAESFGVPECCDGYMVLERPKGFVSRRTRMKDRLQPGELVKPTAKLVWRCKNPKCKARANLFVDDDPLLHTYYPRRGDGKNALIRRALMRKRNIVEGLFSTLKLRGKGLRDQAAPKWMDEHWDCDWLIGGSLFAITLNRYVHHMGHYAEAFVELDDLGLLPKL